MLSLGACLDTILRKWGYEVIATHDGEEAWRALEADSTIRLALIDWMMPGLDGIKVRRLLRETANRPYVYSIILSQKSQREDLVRGLEAGADDYITKPFDVNSRRDSMLLDGFSNSATRI
jgi:DNA-binding response OmpR family regulator